jgi:hypothetical protein
VDCATETAGQRIEMLQIEQVVLLGIKADGAVVAPLNDVPRNAGDAETGATGHGKPIYDREVVRLTENRGLSPITAITVTHLLLTYYCYLLLLLFYPYLHSVIAPFIQPGAINGRRSEYLTKLPPPSRSETVTVASVPPNVGCNKLTTYPLGISRVLIFDHFLDHSSDMQPVISLADLVDEYSISGAFSVSSEGVAAQPNRQIETVQPSRIRVSVIVIPGYQK